MLALLLGFACGGPEAPQARVLDGGLEVRGEAIERVSIEDSAGRPLVSRRLPEPVSTLEIAVDWGQGGAVIATVRSAAGEERITLDVPAERAVLELSLEAPLGQDGVRVRDGAQLTVVQVGGEAVPVALRARALRAGELRLGIGDAVLEQAVIAGEQVSLTHAVAGDVELRASLGERALTSGLSVAPTTVEAVAGAIGVRAVDFPADPSGVADVARSKGRIDLPSAWWRQVLGRLGLGARARDPWAPWGWHGIDVVNTGDRALNAVVRSRVLDADGRSDPAFRPRVRDGTDGTGTVSALIRIPAGGSARAVLPVYVDESLLGFERARDEHWTLQTEIVPLGRSELLASEDTPLYVSRGSGLAGAGLLVAIGAALLGSLTIFFRAPVWLREARTSELMTIAVFGALAFVVGAAARLIGTGVGAVLGPFSPLLTGLVDDAFRYVLLCTLITLIPRVGTASLAVLTSWVLSGLALGSFTSTDILFVGGRVFWLEGALWLSGLTRNRSWLDASPFSRWVRLSLGFGVASALTSATGIVLHVTLYRLFYAPWYVALMIALPGFAYVVLACGLAVPFADSLRRIQR